MIKNVYWPPSEVPVFCVKLQYFSRDFRKKKNSNIKFHENTFSGSRVPCGLAVGGMDKQTDGHTHDEATIRSPRFFERT